VPIELLTAADKISVVTTGKVKKGTIMLPPCVPKQSKVFDRSEHPDAVKFTTKVMQATASCADATVLRQCQFYVLPELKIPMKKQPTTNTAGADAETSAVAAQQEPEWIWAQGGADTMHPFWAVRRLTDKQLQQAKVDYPKGKMAPRFNCELLPQTLSVVCIASISQKLNNSTRMIEMPCLTNSIDLEEGEELLLETTATTNKHSAVTKRSWRDAEKAEAQEKNKRRGGYDRTASAAVQNNSRSQNHSRGQNHSRYTRADKVGNYSKEKQAFMRATSSAVAVAPFIVRGGIGGLGRGPGL
jgi:hypothetical protein